MTAETGGRRIMQFGGQSEVDPLRRVLMKDPDQVFGEPDQHTREWKELNYLRMPDPDAAREEHRAFRNLLENLGATVEELVREPTTGMDSIYTRDAALMTDRGAILCNMGKAARAGEPDAQHARYLELGIPIVGAITGTGRLEGGDFLWLGGGTAAVGRGYRTNDEGIRQLRVLLGSEVELVVVPLPHWKGPSDVFHLMSVISPIDADLALVYSPLLPVPFREFLLARGIQLVEVPDQEFESMGCNVLTLAPRVSVMLEGNPVTKDRLGAAGVEVHTYRGQEISVPGSGGPTCLTRPLLRS